ncbi:MAG: periplasmic heavy metal sensor [Desulfobacterales bacterium]|nr:periplasmic heavy metal sensor [Deltaproteobacteria bacterium]NNL75535.1 periplasmic heavy metal sensor [Desulfobacterales bacterium]
MVRKRLFFMLIVFLVFGVAAFSGCRRHGGNHRAEFMIDYVAEVLDLTETQQEQLNQIKNEFVDKGRQMHANREAMHTEIIEQLKSEEIDQESLRKLVAVKRAQMDELIDLMIVRLAEFHRTLSPEQKNKLVAKLESFKKWHRHDWE